MKIAIPFILVLAACSASPEDAFDHGGSAVVGAGTGDGAPTRQACSGSLGNALSAKHGRLDGYLVSIVPLGGSKTCNGDANHVHLQVKMNGSLYDVAVNADGGFIDTIDAPLPGGPWSEGWHAGQALDYVSAFGVHSTSFSTAGLAPMATRIEQALASANHISIFATGYDATGVHDVHRRGSQEDGAIAIDPLSPNAHFLLFHFSDQSF